MGLLQANGKGILGICDPPKLWQDIIKQIPLKILENKSSKFLFPAIGNATEVKVLANKLKDLGWNRTEILDAFYLCDKYYTFTNPAKAQGFSHVHTGDFLDWDIDMKFDVVIGNPPYQRSKEFGSHNSAPLYKEFSSKSEHYLKDEGVMLFITPTTAITNTLPNMHSNVCLVDYTANKQFDVGVEVCWWMIANTAEEQLAVAVTNLDGSTTANSVNNLYEKELIVPQGIRKKIKETPVHERLFIRDRSADNTRGTTNAHIYPVVGKAGETEYSSVVSKYDNIEKLVLARSKTFTKDNIIFSNDRYGANYLFVDLTAYSIDEAEQYIFCEEYVTLDKFLKQKFNSEFGVMITYMPTANCVKNGIYNYFNFTQQEINYIETFK